MAATPKIAACWVSNWKMRQDQYVLRKDSDAPPFSMGEMVWSSDATDWTGFRLQIYRSPQYMRVSEADSTCAQIGLCLSGISEMEVETRQLQKRAISTAGSVVIAPRGLEFKSLSWVGSTDILMVELDLSRIKAATEGDCFPTELTPFYRFHVRDLQVSTFLHRMLNEARNGCPSGRLYGQAVSFALGAYVLGRYADAENQPRPAAARFSAAQTSLIRDYVHTHMSDNPSLHELARSLRLSVPRFCMLFKNTFGTTPHHYILNERILESLRLISAGQMSIGEIAYSLGFADQSRFTTVFRKITAITPKQYSLSQRGVSG